MSKRSSASVSEQKHKLARLGRESFVSNRGIDKLLHAVRSEGIPEHSSRGAIYRARKHLCATVTPYGPLVQRMSLPANDGSMLEIGFQHPLAMLYHCASVSEDLSSVLRDSLAKHPCSPNQPWTLMLYQDGVDPSDGLAKNHSRKNNAFYWSFLELGMDALSKEQCWFPIAAVRSDLTKKMPGGVVHLTDALASVFFDKHGHNLLKSGINIKLAVDGSKHVLFARLDVVLADEPALKEVFSCMEHAGNKPCMLCLNAVPNQGRNGSEPIHSTNPYAVSIAEPDIRKFTLQTGETIRESLRRLVQFKRTLPKARFEEMETLYGFRLTDRSIILNEELRLDAVSALMFDWAHCYVCDGLADEEWGRFMKAMSSARSKTTYKEFGQYVATWTFPKALPGNVGHLFTDSANRNNLARASFSSTASEFLTLCPVMLRYMTHICTPRGQGMVMVESMIAVLLVVEALQAVKRGLTTPDALRALIVRHIRCFIAAYGANSMRPKHHYVPLPIAP